MSGGDDNVGLALYTKVEIHSPPEVGNAGTYHGVAGYRTWEGLWMDAWEEFQNAIQRAEPVGERHVVVDARQRATGRGSGVEVDRVVSMLCEIRDGRLVRFHIYATHEQALAVARQGES